MKTTRRSTAIGLMAALLTLTSFTAPASAAPTSSFRMFCTSAAGDQLGQLTFTYKDPKTVGTKVVQTYDTIRFTSPRKEWTRASGQVAMTLDGVMAANKSFTLSANRARLFNWKLAVDGNRTLGAAFSATITVSGTKVKPVSGSCSQETGMVSAR